jgi:hypothetical protein
MQDDELAELRAELAGMSEADLEAFERQFDAEVARVEAQARSTTSRPSPTPTPSPAPSPSAAPPPPAKGLPAGHDVAEGYEQYDSLDQPGDHPLRDPSVCFANQAAIRQWAAENANRPRGQFTPMPV